MLHPAASSFVLTALLYSYDVANDCSRSLTKYTVIFLVLLGTLFAYRGDAFEIESPLIMVEKGDEDYISPLWATEHKFKHHRYWATIFYNMSYRVVIYQPKGDDRDLAKLCFSTAVATAVPPYTSHKIIAIAIGLFTKYGLDCIDNFHLSYHYLHRAKYHADLEEFYEEILKNEKKEKGYTWVHRRLDEDGNEIERTEGHSDD